MQQQGSASLIWAEAAQELLLNKEEMWHLETSQPGEQKGAQSVLQVLAVCWGRAEL